MKQSSFKFMQGWLRAEIGLNLVDGKEYLIEASLSSLIGQFNCHDIDGLIQNIKNRSNRALTEAVKDAMTVNETYFFRDKAPFDYFEDEYLPFLIQEKRAAGDMQIRIWCAAASSGQEPYSLAMIIQKYKKELLGFQIDIVGTDISLNALSKAKKGTYSQFEVQRGMPIQYLIENFEQVGADWNIKPNIKKMVSFRTLNLLAPYSNMGRFDLIFCRNVLFYFDKVGKAQVIKKLTHCLNDDGLLVLGSAETLVGMSDNFQSVKGQTGCFQKQPKLGRALAQQTASISSLEPRDKFVQPDTKPVTPEKTKSKTLQDLDQATQALMARLEQRKSMRS